MTAVAPQARNLVVVVTRTAGGFDLHDDNGIFLMSAGARGNVAARMLGAPSARFKATLSQGGVLELGERIQ